MKKSLRYLFIGLVLIIGSEIISLTVKFNINTDFQAILLIGILGIGKIVGIGLLGSFFTKNRANYSWYEIPFDKKFQIIKILETGPKSPRMKTVIYLEDFGVTICFFPIDKSSWGEKSPQEGENFKRKGLNTFVLVP